MAQSINPVEVLVHFSREVSDTAAPAEIMPLLADAAVAHLGADAAAVFSVAAGGLLLVAARRLPEQMQGLVLGADAIGPELGRDLLAACEQRFAQAHSLPLVSSGDLFGALVLLFRQPAALLPAQRELAAGLTDLAALALSNASRFEQLRRSYRELRESRELLARSEKLRALGQLAAGVSHDLKNILSPLLMQVQLLRMPSAGLSEEEVAEILERMEKVLWRGVETVDRLRTFGRQTPDRQMAPALVDELVRQAIALCRPRLRERNEIHVEERLGGPPPVPLESSECMNAVLNLLVNAIDAMPEGGRITVSTGVRDGGVWIEVRDTGPGIPDEVAAHLFEPFFTTKGEQGTGLGLSMVYAFAQRHRGWVKADSAPGKGTAFTIWLPLGP